MSSSMALRIIGGIAILSTFPLGFAVHGSDHRSETMGQVEALKLKFRLRGNDEDFSTKISLYEDPIPTKIYDIYEDNENDEDDPTKINKHDSTNIIADEDYQPGWPGYGVRFRSFIEQYIYTDIEADEDYRSAQVNRVYSDEDVGLV